MKIMYLWLLLPWDRTVKKYHVWEGRGVVVVGCLLISDTCKIHNTPLLLFPLLLHPLLSFYPISCFLADDAFYVSLATAKGRISEKVSSKICLPFFSSSSKRNFREEEVFLGKVLKRHRSSCLGAEQHRRGPWKNRSKCKVFH